MTAYETGYAFGQAFGYLLVAGVFGYILYRRYRKKKKKEDQNYLDEV
ncbi:MAG: hypothetical protein HYZ14_17965 [Bacteroidetes bacterium]|nr:hypothetical protein [Bacteroidota bacterium]